MSVAMPVGTIYLVQKDIKGAVVIADINILLMIIMYCTISAGAKMAHLSGQSSFLRKCSGLWVVS
jgi:hypothetical protein